MKYIKDNLVLKLFSVCLALLLWLIVFNVSNPEQKGSRNVELHILHQDVFSAENKTWEVDRSTITVSYTVRSNRASSVQASDFNAYIDLNDYSITGSVPVYVELKNAENSGQIQDIVAKPSVVRVNVEDLQIKKFSLTTHRRGKEQDGYLVSSIHTEPETIYVTGPESSVGRISSVGILVNVDGLHQNTSGTEKAVFYDANGKTIGSLENVSLSQENIDYTVVVNKKKDLRVSATTIGTPQNGYSVEKVEVSPASIPVSGNEGLLDSLNSLSLPAIDVSSAQSDIKKEYPIEDFLPKGVSLTEPNKSITVIVKLKKNEETQKSGGEKQESVKDTEESKTESTAESSTEESKEEKSSEESKAGGSSGESKSASGKTNTESKAANKSEKKSVEESH